MLTSLKRRNKALLRVGWKLLSKANLFLSGLELKCRFLLYRLFELCHFNMQRLSEGHFCICSKPISCFPNLRKILQVVCSKFQIIRTQEIQRFYVVTQRLEASVHPSAQGHIFTNYHVHGFQQ